MTRAEFNSMEDAVNLRKAIGNVERLHVAQASLAVGFKAVGTKSNGTIPVDRTE